LCYIFKSDASEEDSDALESETEKDRADDDILEKEDFETPSEKRIHLAKEYLSTISKEEAAGDLENSRLTVHERISHRLKREQVIFIKKYYNLYRESYSNLILF
jgi:cobalamin-dependent methionine synthase I